MTRVLHGSGRGHHPLGTRVYFGAGIRTCLRHRPGPTPVLRAAWQVHQERIRLSSNCITTSSEDPHGTL
jgi:hypothetical protein